MTGSVSQLANLISGTRASPLIPSQQLEMHTDEFYSTIAKSLRSQRAIIANQASREAFIKRYARPYPHRYHAALGERMRMYREPGREVISVEEGNQAEPEREPFSWTDDPPAYNDELPRYHEVVKCGKTEDV